MRKLKKSRFTFILIRKEIREMVWKKRVFAIATLVLMVVILSGLIVSPALGQQPERVKVLIGFTRQPGPAEQALVHRAGGTIKYTYHLVPAIAATLPEPAIPGLLANPNVTRIEPDGEVWAIDAELDNTWGVKHIGAGVVHAYNKGTGVKVAIIDSGIDYTHKDLDANYVGGRDFVNNDDDPMDDNGHGTHVAGTVAAKDNDIGVVGVAPQAQLYALKVFPAEGGGSYSDVIAALEWAVDNGMQVTNNSYGSSGDPGVTVKAAFDKAYAAGVLNVCAAGNSGNPPGRGDNVIYPARYASCIAVAATDKNDNRASFSSTGTDVELAAPGVAINSTLWGGGYGEKNGTSMASPHVAGTAALVIATGITDANGDGNVNDEVRQRLIETADDLGAAGRDPQYGYGLVDADEAAPPSPVATGTIAGTVTEFEGGTISDASVVVEGTSLSITTNDNGEYSIGNVPEGTYDVTASAVGFVSETKTATVNEDQTTTVDFALSPIPVGSITGTVTNSDDSMAISGATVTVDTGQSDTTAADGTYTINDVPTGDRLVTASADGFESQTKTAPVEENLTTTVGFVLNPVTTVTTVRVQITDGADDVNDSCSSVNTSGANEIYFGLDENCDADRLYSAGFLFRNVDIPAGVTIINAHLEFVVDGPYNNDLTVHLCAEATGESANFDPWNSSCEDTTYEPWHITGNWKSGTRVSSPDISKVIEQIISSVWTQGDALIITGDTNTWEKKRASHRRVFAHERDPGSAAVLIVEYGPP